MAASDDMSKVEAIIADLNCSLVAARQHCMLESVVWASEMIKDIHARLKTPVAPQVLSVPSAITVTENLSQDERSLYDLATILFAQQQYKRVQELLLGCSAPVCRFIRCYAAYFHADHTRLSTNLQPIGGAGNDFTDEYADALRAILLEVQDDIKLSNAQDGFLHFLHGVILARIGNDVAIVKQSLIKAVNLCPYIWAFWQFLATFVSSEEELHTFDVPKKSWLYQLFRAEAMFYLAEYGQSLEIYEKTAADAVIGQSGYVQLRLALTLKHLQQNSRAISILRLLFEADPYRVDVVEALSDLFYIDQDRNSLAHLAHHLLKFAPRRPETAYVIGNYYSLRGEHERSAEYLWRSSQLQPWKAAPLIILGHEYLELHNTSSAARAYRRAADLDSTDYRPFVALGQLHKIVNQRQLSLYYFLRASRLQPSSTMLWLLLGETYEELDDIENAIRCYWRGVLVGDSTGKAIYRFASLHEKKGDFQAAVSAFVKYLETCDEFGLSQSDQQYHACVFVARHMLDARNYQLVRQVLSKAVELNLYNEELRSLEQMVAEAEAVTGGATTAKHNDSNLSEDMITPTKKK